MIRGTRYYKADGDRVGVFIFVLFVILFSSEPMSTSRHIAARSFPTRPAPRPCSRRPQFLRSRSNHPPHPSLPSATTGPLESLFLTHPRDPSDYQVIQSAQHVLSAPRLVAASLLSPPSRNLKTGGRVRITAQLVDGLSNDHISV